MVLKQSWGYKGLEEIVRFCLKYLNSNQKGYTMSIPKVGELQEQVDVLYEAYQGGNP